MSGLLVRIKLFGGLKPPINIEPDENGIYHMELKEGFTVSNLIDMLSLTGKPLIVVVNNIICNDYNQSIKSGDTISFFPPVAGG
ncbi:MAG: MoaD/ThiS family protein [Proteobacteria bacterium]|nr:MoaD/ThiS family protein [Pseudomonadota bacterium]